MATEYKQLYFNEIIESMHSMLSYYDDKYNKFN